MNRKRALIRWRANFFTGLAIVLPAVISIAVVIWLFGTVANITDTLLIFLPKKLTHRDQGAGSMHWYWSLLSLVMALMMFGLICGLVRHLFGRKAMDVVVISLLRMPLF